MGSSLLQKIGEGTTGRLFESVSSVLPSMQTLTLQMMSDAGPVVCGSGFLTLPHSGWCATAKESLGEGIARAFKALAQANADAAVVLPVAPSSCMSEALQKDHLTAALWICILAYLVLWNGAFLAVGLSSRFLEAFRIVTRLPGRLCQQRRASIVV